MASKIFITATDTEAGKTWVTTSAVRSLLSNGVNAKALKPIACGLDATGDNEDIKALLSTQNLNQADQINLYRFALPAAPAQAATAEAQSINTDRLLQWCKTESATVDTCLIEGVGGLMVPITDHWLVSDWIQAMPDCEIWLVVTCKLGAINQTLLTLEKLKQMGRMPTHVFFNATTAETNTWIKPTIDAVTPFLSSHSKVMPIQYGEKAVFPIV